jgi:hypothetical protein
VCVCVCVCVCVRAHARVCACVCMHVHTHVHTLISTPSEKNYECCVQVKPIQGCFFKHMREAITKWIGTLWSAAGITAALYPCHNSMYCPLLPFQRVAHVDVHYKVWADRMVQQHRVPLYEHPKIFFLAHGMKVLDSITILGWIGSDMRALNGSLLVLCVQTLLRSTRIFHCHTVVIWSHASVMLHSLCLTVGVIHATKSRSVTVCSSSTANRFQLSTPHGSNFSIKINK